MWDFLEKESAENGRYSIRVLVLSRLLEGCSMIHSSLIAGGLRKATSPKSATQKNYVWGSISKAVFLSMILWLSKSVTHSTASIKDLHDLRRNVNSRSQFATGMREDVEKVVLHHCWPYNFTFSIKEDKSTFSREDFFKLQEVVEWRDVEGGTRRYFAPPNQGAAAASEFHTHWGNHEISGADLTSYSTRERRMKSITT